MKFCSFTIKTSINDSLDIPLHLWPIKVFFENFDCLVDARMTNQASLMCLSHKQFSLGPFWSTQMIVFEEKPLMNNVVSVCTLGTLNNNRRHVQVINIAYLQKLDSKYPSIESDNYKIPSRQDLRNSISYTLFIMRDKGEGLDKLYPLYMPWVDIVLATYEFQFLVI